MKINNSQGQSTIEFILTFTVVVGFIFLFLKLAINYTNGYMVHYATFMASRSYLVVDAERYPTPDTGDQPAFVLAKEVFKRNLPSGLIIPDVVLKNENENSPTRVNYHAFVGIWTEFEQPFSLGFIGGRDKVLFRSESFLGREPTRAESYNQVCEAIMSVTEVSCNFHVTLDDNGG